VNSAETSTSPVKNGWTAPKIVRRRRRKERRFTRPLTIYLKPDQYTDLETRAQARHQTISRHGRLALTRGMKRALPVPLEVVVLAELEAAMIELREKRACMPPQSPAGKAMDRALTRLGIARDALRQVGNQGSDGSKLHLLVQEQPL
jgi:hypothetical protein